LEQLLVNLAFLVRKIVIVPVANVEEDFVTIALSRQIVRQMPIANIPTNQNAKNKPVFPLLQIVKQMPIAKILASQNAKNKPVFPLLQIVKQMQIAKILASQNAKNKPVSPPQRSII
jgi:hypothetical protein